MHNNWEEPSGVIDHINGDSLDNRIENLRNVTHTENMANRSNASQYGCVSMVMVVKLSLYLR